MTQQIHFFAEVVVYMTLEDTYTMIIAAWFIVANNWKQPKHSLKIE